MYRRQLDIRLPRGQSAFLWGARQTGKSTYLREHFPSSIRYDFLQSDLYLSFLKEPCRLREELLANPSLASGQPVLLDEVQKIPLLLDEVHWLIENKKVSFILCGSSARKLKRERANLLGGRAWRYEMHPLVFPEVPGLDLLRALNQGLLPAHYQTDHAGQALKAYVSGYLTEEIKAEGLSRNLAAFAKFLEAASFSHGQLVQYKNIASDCGVDSKTVKEYFEILKDTYVGSLLPPLHRKKDRKTLTATPKFYFSDPGVATFLSKTPLLQLKGSQAGTSFEGYIYHEISSYLSYAGKDLPLHYWRTTTGHEVDFLLNEGEIAVETKISDHVKVSDLTGLRSFLGSGSTRKACVVCLEKRPRLITTPEGYKVHVLPWKKFLEDLWGGSIVEGANGHD